MLAEEYKPWFLGGVKWAGHGLDHSPRLAPRLRKSRTITLLLSVAWLVVNFAFTFTNGKCSDYTFLFSLLLLMPFWVQMLSSSHCFHTPSVYVVASIWETKTTHKFIVYVFDNRHEEGKLLIKFCPAFPEFNVAKEHKLIFCFKMGRGQLTCDVTRAESRFRLSAKRTSSFKSSGASVQSTTGSRGVHISGGNAGYTMFRGSVKGNGYPLHSPVSPSLPLPCITVCHHISTGLYHTVVHLFRTHNFQSWYLLWPTAVFVCRNSSFCW
jgi:hypothetical protein